MQRKAGSADSISTSAFDYIIVGAGSAGCVLATELSRGQSGTVLLIEAGSKAGHYQSRRPVLYPHLFDSPDLSYRDRSAPQVKLGGRSILLPSGKGLGGSSLINATIVVRPGDEDLRHWHQLLGDSWDPERTNDLLDELLESLKTHIDHKPTLHPLSRQILDRCSQAPIPESLFPYARLVRHGRRESIWRALGEFRNSASISMLRGAKVNSVQFSGSRAVGVEVSASNGSSSEAIRANKAVVLCAGALKTPTILMKSGIGPKSAILPHRNLIVDSPWVGKQLCDHLVFPITYSTSEESLPSRFCADENRTWLRSGEGPLASNIAELGAFLWADEQGAYSLEPAKSNAPPSVQWHITPTHYLEYPTKHPSTNAMSIGVTMLHPKSRGEIRWEKDGSFTIDPMYLIVESDLSEFVAATQWTRQWVQAGPLQSMINDELLPGSKRQDDRSVQAMVQRLATTIYHYIGTAAIGADSASVCNANFEVRGCERLYVCDASSLPTQPSGNPQLAVMLLAKMLPRTIAT
ncbi:GMC family oxidoreductase [Pirellulaceae bacterium SH449]